MKRLAWLIGVLSIAAIALTPLAFIAGSLSLDTYKVLSLVLTLVWFVTSFIAFRAESTVNDASA